MYGIIQRSLKYLFTQLHQQQGNKIVRASYLEIYNEQVGEEVKPGVMLALNCLCVQVFRWLTTRCN